MKRNKNKSEFQLLIIDNFGNVVDTHDADSLSGIVGYWCGFLSGYGRNNTTNHLYRMQPAPKFYKDRIEIDFDGNEINQEN